LYNFMWKLATSPMAYTPATLVSKNVSVWVTAQDRRNCQT
jgi:hypothetical protein